MNISCALRALVFVPAFAAALSFFAASASAQEAARDGRGLGVGYAAMLAGPSGAAVAFDGGNWHAEGLLGFWSHNGNTVELGARAFFHLHGSASADFSIGGGLGFRQQSPDVGDDQQVVGFDVGFMIRAFLVSNVALGAFGGLGIRSGDVPDNQATLLINGQPVGSLSLTYYFH